MESSVPHATEDDFERLRRALAAEKQRRLQAEKQLEGANANFEDFISIASHDLRESLRVVGSYTQLLNETYADRLDPDAHKWLGSMQDGVTRMQSLLTDIVAYWATDPTGREPRRVEMEGALSQALLFTDESLTRAGAAVTHDPLPVVMGDFETATKVLQHLIGNAIKFCGKPHPRIHISYRREDRECVFSVRDNGPGIDSAFHDRIFGVFKRLHGKQFPGSGLGLAFCKKAIERQGGRIWVESTPGEGSTFFFTLPEG